MGWFSRILVVCGASLAVFVAGNNVVRAAVARADVDDRYQIVTSTSGTANSFFAESDQTAPTQVGPNENTGYKVFGSDQPVISPVPVESGTMINISHGLYGTSSYGPVIAVKNQPKPTSTNKILQFLYSTSGAFHAVADANYTAGGFLRSAGTSLYASASIQDAEEDTAGTAAAAAFDPVVLSAPDTDYTPLLSATVQLDNTNQSGEANVFVTDSSIDPDIDNFVEDKSPMSQTLWEASAYANGPITDISDLHIDFELNPQAMNEITLPSSWLAEQLWYSPGMSNVALAQAFDLYIDSEMATAFSINAGSATLDSFSPFPTDTIFAPGESVEYAEGSDAGVAQSPLPAPVLAGIALIALLAGGKTWQAKCRQV